MTSVSRLALGDVAQEVRPVGLGSPFGYHLGHAPPGHGLRGHEHVAGSPSAGTRSSRAPAALAPRCASRQSAVAASRPCTRPERPRGRDASGRRAPSPSPRLSPRCGAAESPIRLVTTVSWAGAFDDRRGDREVVMDELRWARVVGRNATHTRRGQHDGIRSVHQHPPFHFVLLTQIDPGPRGGEDVASPTSQRAGDRRAHQASRQFTVIRLSGRRHLADRENTTAI